MTFKTVNRVLFYTLSGSVLFLAGVWLGTKISYNYPILVPKNKFDKLARVSSLINNSYPDSVDMDKITDKTIKTMLNTLDPHSRYYDAEYFDGSQASLQGNFEGIGVEFNIFKDTVFVINVIVGGPSEKVGLLAGDKIISVDGKNFTGSEIDNLKVVKTLRGIKGSKVKVGVLRGQQVESLSFEIIRAKIPVTTVDFAQLDQTGYLKISRFGAKTYEEFKKALEVFSESKIQRLILDLRGNGGGYLSSAVKIADAFLERNTLITYTKGKDSRYNKTYKAEKEVAFAGQVVVLLDGYSASASEIVAGALQDHDRALIVGRRSFGKGLVQQGFDFEDGSKLYLTISRYYTPSGRCIQKPYDDVKNYSTEIFRRSQQGEFFTADSIKLDSSAIFYTQNKRVVYGSGGIIPDYFIGLDTSHQSPLLTSILRQQIISEFTFQFADDYRSTLQKMRFGEFITDPLFTKKIIGSFIDFARAKGLKINRVNLLQSPSYAYLKAVIKALIARQFWGESSYHTLLVTQDKVVQKSLTIFEKIDKLLQPN